MHDAYTEDQVCEQSTVGMFTEVLTAIKPALLAADGEWQQVAIKEAPTFRVISLLGPDENALSDIFAELLDPNGSHGQGAAFLNLFLSHCSALNGCSITHVSIHRESRTIFIERQKRRIDILINGGDWGIGIENKPWAGEQKKQLQDYADDLQKCFDDKFILIRLTGRDGETTSLEAATQKRLSARDKFISWRYDSELLSWVNQCRNECHAPRVSALLDELSRYILAEFTNATNPRANMERKHLLPALQSIIDKDPGQFHSAAAIAELFPVFRDNFLNDLFDEIVAGVRAAVGTEWKKEQWTQHFVTTDWAPLGLQHPDWRGLYQVRLESQPKYGLVVLGIWHDKRVITRNEHVARDLRRLGWGKKPGGPSWDGHSPLPQPFTNWTTPSGITAIFTQRAELKALLIEGFVKLCSHFRNPLAKLAKATVPNQASAGK